MYESLMCLCGYLQKLRMRYVPFCASPRLKSVILWYGNDCEGYLMCNARKRLSHNSKFWVFVRLMHVSTCSSSSSAPATR